jgi:hypothetical protein
MGVALAEWTDLLRREYLEEFIPSGGAAVKIAVVTPSRAEEVVQAMRAAAGEQAFFVASLDSSQTRVHMIDQVLYTVTRQVDWDSLTDDYLRLLLNENGIAVDYGVPLHDLAAIAEANGRSTSDLLHEINLLIANSVLRDYSLSKEFRTAMAMLCRGRVNPQNVSPTDADLIKQWLRGERCNLPALKRVQIYQRVGRHNARLLLGSLARWLRRVGYNGLALVLDMTAVVTDYRPGEVPVRYTRSTLLDVYEVLRQFIDDVDEVAYLFVGVVAGPGLVEDPRRSVDNYTALKLRIVDEVRDRDRANPLNAMVRIEA